MVPEQDAFTEEPYGIGVNAENVDLVRLHQRGARGHARRRVLAGQLRQVAGADPGRGDRPAPAGLRPLMTTAPVAPGRIGEAIEPAAIQDYLRDLEAWVRARRTELDELDAAALAADRGAEVASDMALSLSAVEGGLRPLPADLRDLGRRPGARERAAADLHADLGPARRRQRPARRAGGLAARGLPALRRAGRPAPDPALPGARRRRLGRPDQAAAGPAGAAAATRCPSSRRPCARQRRRSWASWPAGWPRSPSELSGGGDVGGMLGPLEIDATTYERDLIVGNATAPRRPRPGDRRPRPARRPRGPRGGLGAAGRPVRGAPSTRRRTTRSPTSTRSGRSRTLPTRSAPTSSAWTGWPGR